MRLAFEGLDDPWMPPPLNLLEDLYFFLHLLPLPASAKAAAGRLAWWRDNKVMPDSAPAVQSTKVRK